MPEHDETDAPDGMSPEEWQKLLDEEEAIEQEQRKQRHPSTFRDNIERK